MATNTAIVHVLGYMAAGRAALGRAVLVNFNDGEAHLLECAPEFLDGSLGASSEEAVLLRPVAPSNDRPFRWMAVSLLAWLGVPLLGEPGYLETVLPVLAFPRYDAARGMELGPMLGGGCP